MIGIQISNDGHIVRIQGTAKAGDIKKTSLIKASAKK
jgi:hypothetical protein